MNANETLLQMKYTRIVSLFAKQMNITLDEALRFFYKSITYDLMKDGISDMHCMREADLVEDLEEEYRNQ